MKKTRLNISDEICEEDQDDVTYGYTISPSSISILVWPLILVPKHTCEVEVERTRQQPGGRAGALMKDRNASLGLAML